MSAPLTEEQIAVTFALCSRSATPFDQSAKEVTTTRAAAFNQRWVVNYGHASVAEHAVAHLAVENISRLAADHLERGRLRSYTEKSSRYQVMPSEAWHTPEELRDHPGLSRDYHQAMSDLFAVYRETIAAIIRIQSGAGSSSPDQDEPAGAGRLRRQALDSARALLPASLLTSLGMTVNARSLAYLIARQRSAPLAEDNRIGQLLLEQGETAFPSLLRHAEPTPALAAQQDLPPPSPSNYGARLFDYDPQGQAEVADALRFSGRQDPNDSDVRAIAQECRQLGIHDELPREFELPYYSFELTLDYGALRELRRHRMMTLLERPLTTRSGHYLPPEIAGAGQSRQTAAAALDAAAAVYDAMTSAGLNHVAQYAVCHAHLQTVRLKLNLRQLRHLARLRTQPQAHESIRRPVHAMLYRVAEVHPVLYQAALAPVVATTPI